MCIWNEANIAASHNSHRHIAFNCTYIYSNEHKYYSYIYLKLDPTANRCKQRENVFSTRTKHCSVYSVCKDPLNNARRPTKPNHHICRPPTIVFPWCIEYYKYILYMCATAKFWDGGHFKLKHKHGTHTHTHTPVTMDNSTSTSPCAAALAKFSHKFCRTFIKGIGLRFKAYCMGLRCHMNANRTHLFVKCLLFNSGFVIYLLYA